MSNQSQKSPLPENSAEEEEEEGQQEEEEDKKLQEPSQEATGGGGGGDERKAMKEVATLPTSAQKTSVARKGPVLKRCAANATNSCPLKKVTRAEVEQQQHIHSLSILLQKLQKPLGGGRGDKRKVTHLPPSAQKTSTARNGPARKPYVANLIRAEPCKKVRTRAISSRRVYNLNAKSLQASKKFYSPRQPLGTPAERPLENSAKDGVSQGKEKKIKDKVHGEDDEDDEEGEGGGEENPDDSDSI